MSATNEPDAAPLLADRYELGEALGHGGMADVYRAMDRVLDREVAVKLLRESGADESDRSRFIAEARTLARLSHSGLVTVLDAGFGPDTHDLPSGIPASARADQPYLVMELVDGPTLRSTINRGPVPLADVGAIGVQLAEALAYVHTHDLVHRDIKPGNVLLGSEGRVKLADFGIARLLSDTSGHTRTGEAIGTAAYLSPEQVTAGTVTGATDIYSLGLVLLEALTAQRAYPGTTTESAVARLHRPPHIPESVPDEWQRLLTAMTAPDPADRPTAGQVAHQLSDQPTAPIPAATHDTADATTAPLLSTAEPTASTSSSTQVIPDTGPTRTSVLAPESGGGGTQPPWHDRAGDAVARQPRALANRLRALTASQRVLLGAVTALVLLLGVAAVVGGSPDGSGRSPVPDNTPADLRGPLQDLHDAVNGEAG